MFKRTESRKTPDLMLPTLALAFTLGLAASLFATVAPQPTSVAGGYTWIDGEGIAHILDLGDHDATASIDDTEALAQF